ncbi:MAG: type I restriction enzyme HsdR N-terminal domain-containing protein [Chitinophagaceae bacterium]|nr:type I restriction enzyme HsdR N-terminal domain-containing protein [Chitinophagaceae bacterium]
MIKIEYPEPKFRIKSSEEKDWIFDEFRKQWLQITPEEWVRQNFLQYLVQIKKYPASLIAIEKEIRLGELKKRCDIVVYKNAVPWLIVECKEMSVALNEPVLKQILGYNISLQVQYLIITNGTDTFAFEIANEKIQILEQIPDYLDPQLLNA